MVTPQEQRKAKGHGHETSEDNQTLEHGSAFQGKGHQGRQRPDSDQQDKKQQA
jgi:hypothetical protein